MKLPRHALLSAAISALVLGVMPTAHAGSISLDFDGAVTNNFFGMGPSVGTPFSASLVFTTAGDASSFEAVTGVTGTIFGQTITGLGGDGGLNWGPVNQITTADPYFNNFGVFMTGPGSDIWRIVSFSSNTWTAINESNYWGADVNPSIAPAVPEPGTYAMLIAGLGVLGAVSRRQKKSAQRMAALA